MEAIILTIGGIAAVCHYSSWTASDAYRRRIYTGATHVMLALGMAVFILGSLA